MSAKWSQTGFFPSKSLKITVKKTGNVRVNVILKRVCVIIITVEKQ